MYPSQKSSFLSLTPPPNVCVVSNVYILCFFLLFLLVNIKMTKLWKKRTLTTCQESILMPGNDTLLLRLSKSHDGSQSPLGTQICAVAWNLICWLEFERAISCCWYQDSTWLYCLSWLYALMFLFSLSHFQLTVVQNTNLNIMQRTIKTWVKSSFNYCGSKCIYKYGFPLWIK